MNRETRKQTEWKTVFKGWIVMSRLPFHLVGVLPFLLGAVLSWRINEVFDWPVFLWSVVAVILIMLSTYYAGEYYDLQCDKLSAVMGRNIFSGGSQVILKGIVPHKHALTASYITLILAGIIGFVLQFLYKTGPLTIPLGVIGVFCGFFYSTEPIRLVKRGFGEVIIGFCYGWLTVAASYYLQCGRIDTIVNWVSIPIACSIFNVILINEFPDYRADSIEGKANLVVRFGREKAAFLYIIISIISVVSFPLSVSKELPLLTYAFYPIILALSVSTIYLILKKSYLDKKRLEMTCGLTILINLCISAAYILALCFGNI